MEINIETFNYNNLQTNLTEKRLSAMKKGCIFHYTNIEALVNIIKTNTLWATHCKYLNDLMELKDFERLLNDLLKTKNEKYYEYIKAFFDLIYKELFEKLREKTYIISFSKDNDAIPMWKDYGNKGVVIEFDTTIMIDTIKVDEIDILDRNNEIKEISTVKRYGTAVYEDDYIINIFELSFEALSRLNVLENPEKEDEVRETLIKLLYDVFYGMYIQKKDKNYIYENEFRMAFTLQDNDIGKIENYRIKNGLIIPYIAIKFDNNGLLPLKSVTINPGHNDCMFEEGIKHLLKAYNYDIPIKYSSNKIR